MNILKNIWSNIFAAMLGVVVASAVQLLVWGEHAREQAVPWFVLFYIIFQSIDIIKWGFGKYRGNV